MNFIYGVIVGAITGFTLALVFYKREIAARNRTIAWLRHVQFMLQAEKQLAVDALKKL